MNYLSHHGILGQKWGRKSGPPYPLKPSDHSASEKKAGWKKSLEREGQNKLNVNSTAKNKIVRSSGSRNTETMKRARQEDIDKLSTKELKEYNERLNAEKQFAELTKGNVSSGKKWAQKLLVGAATSVVTPILVSVGKKAVEKAIERATSKPDPFDDFEDIIFK